MTLIGFTYEGDNTSPTAHPCHLQILLSFCKVAYIQVGHTLYIPLVSAMPIAECQLAIEYSLPSATLPQFEGKKWSLQLARTTLEYSLDYWREMNSHSQFLVMEGKC